MRTLFWLERKRLFATVDYILRLFGVEEEHSRMYSIYVGGLLLLWVFTVWAYILEQLDFARRFITVEQLDTGLDLSVGVFFIIHLLYLAYTLRDTPLKMSAPDLALVASSPVSRAVLTIVYLMKHFGIFIFLGAILSTWATMFYTFTRAPELAGYAGLQGFLFGILFLWSSAAIIWALVLLKLHLPIRRYKALFWILPLFLIAVIAFFPESYQPIADLWARTISAQLTMLDWFVLVGMAIISTGLMMFSGSLMHLSVMADESQHYARIQRLGILGRVYARDVIARINRQAKLATRKRRLMTLPVSKEPRMVLWHRAFLSLMRFAPLSIIGLIGIGIQLSALVVGTTSYFGWRAPQTWLIVGLVMVQYRPTALIDSFQQTMQSTFTRQFLPLAQMPLIILAETFFPILLASLGGIVVVVLRSNSLIALLMVPSVTIVLMLCQAIGWFSLPAFNNHRLAYEHVAIASGIVIVGAGYITASLFIALLATWLVIATFLYVMTSARV